MGIKDYIKMELEELLKYIKLRRRDVLIIAIGCVIILSGSVGNPFATPYAVVDNMMEEIKLPPGAVRVSTMREKDGSVYYYKIPGMSDEEVKIYFKKELSSKNWKLKKENVVGNHTYFRKGILLTLETKQTSPDKTSPCDYDFIIMIFALI